MICQDRVCQTCGGVGNRDLQLYCSKCQISMEHRYCLAKMPNVDDKEFKYICGKCELSSFKQSSSTHFGVKNWRPRRIVASAILTQDVRKNLASSTTLANKAEENVRKSLHENKGRVNSSSSSVVNAEAQVETCEVPSFSVTEAEECIHVAPPQTLAADILVKDLPLLKRKRSLVLNDSDESDEEITCARLQEQQATPRRKRKLILSDSDESDGDVTCARYQEPQADPQRKRILNCSDESDEEITLVDWQEPQAASAAPAPAPKIPSPPRSLVEYSHSNRAQPVVDPVWRGCFDMCTGKYKGVVAHLSSNVGVKVTEVSKLMPGILSTEMVSRSDAWPKSFHESAPTDESIALYFFPESEGDIKAVLFHELVTNIMEVDLALRVSFNEAELLIFPSNKLPQNLWRFRGKFYLWGVFKARKNAPTPESDGGCHRLQNVSFDVPYVPLCGIGADKDSKSLRMRPLFPPGNNSSYSPWTAKRHKANALPSSLNRPTTNPLKSCTPRVRHEMCSKQNRGEGEIPVKNLTSTSNSTIGTYQGTEMFGKTELPARNATNIDNASHGTIKNSESSPPRRTNSSYPSKVHGNTLPSLSNVSREGQKANAEAGRNRLPSQPISLQHHPQNQAKIPSTEDKETLVFDKTLMNYMQPMVSQVKLNSPAEVPEEVVNQVWKSIKTDSRVTPVVQFKQKRGDRGKNRKKKNQPYFGKKCNQLSFGKRPDQEKLGKKSKQVMVCHLCQQPGHKRADCRNFGKSPDQEKLRKKSKQVMVCHFCQQPGHKRAGCRNFLAFLEEEKKYLQSLVPEIRIIVQPPNPAWDNNLGAHSMNGFLEMWQPRPPCPWDNNLGTHPMNGALERRQPPPPLYIETPFSVNPS